MPKEGSLMYIAEWPNAAKSSSWPGAIVNIEILACELNSCEIELNPINKNKIEMLSRFIILKFPQ